MSFLSCLLAQNVQQLADEFDEMRVSNAALGRRRRRRRRVARHVLDALAQELDGEVAALLQLARSVQTERQLDVDGRLEVGIAERLSVVLFVQFAIEHRTY